jgi:hypothetical protein
MPEPKKLVRTCFDCGQPITRHAKWTWAQRGQTLTCVHRHCDNPESYNPMGADPVAPAPLFDGAAA